MPLLLSLSLSVLFFLPLGQFGTVLSKVKSLLLKDLQSFWDDLGRLGHVCIVLLRLKYVGQPCTLAHLPICYTYIL